MVGYRRGMVGVTIGKNRTAFIAKIADGVVGVSAILLRLVRAEDAGGRDEWD